MTRQRLSPAARSDLILGEALRLFAERHYSVVTMREIAVACDVNVALIYYYFANKDQLFHAALQAAIGSLEAHYNGQRAQRSDAMASIIAWIDVPATLIPMVVRMVKVMADYAATRAQDPTLDALIADFYARERRLLERALRRGIASGQFRRVDVRQTARFIGLHLDGIFYAATSRGDDRVVADLADLREIVSGMLVPPS